MKEKKGEMELRKFAVGMFSIALILGAGTAVFAAGNPDKGRSFEEMLPLMEKMHPDFTTEELEGMYNDCHGSEGIMNESGMSSEDMMNRF